MKYNTPEAVRNLATQLNASGEPWFVLRAQDALSVPSVNDYADRLEANGDVKGAEDVRALALKMVDWQNRNGDKVKFPD